MSERPQMRTSTAEAILKIIAGERQGDEFPIARSERMVFGRSLGCDIVLRDRGVSRQHFAIEGDAMGFWLRDLGSKNGTYLNGDRKDSALLEFDDIVQAGNLLVRFLPAHESGKSSTSSVIQVLEEDTAPGRTTKISTSRSFDELDLGTASGKSSGLNQERKALDALYRITSIIHSEADPRRLFDVVLQSVLELTGGDRGFLILRRPDAGDDEAFEPKAFRVREGASQALGKPVVSRTIVDQTIREGVAILLSDASHDNRFSSGQSIVIQKIRSVMCVPLETRREIIGCLYIDTLALPGVFTEYDLRFLSAIGKQAAIAIERSQLIQHFVDKERLKNDLVIARQIQEKLLPKASPNIPGLEVSSRWAPCEEMGGDYFDFFPLGERRMAFAIGDVSGHGTGPAMLMATARSFLRAQIDVPGASLPGVLQRLNRQLCEDMDNDRFMTMFLGLFDVDHGTFTYVSAGHDDPIVWVPSEGVVKPLSATGVPLGIVSETDYPLGPTVVMQPEMVILFTTDGIWEAQNARGECFGRERLEQTLADNVEKSASEITRSLILAVDDFRGEAPMADDYTLVTVKISGDHFGETNTQLRHIIDGALL